jgi:hypothetical protein
MKVSALARSKLTLCVCTLRQAYLERFRALPAIAAYTKTQLSGNTPVNNKVAAWGAKVSEASH